MVYRGKAEGKEERKKEGKSEGIREKEKEVIFNMHKINIKIEDICKVVKLTKEEVEKIIEENK